MKLTFRIFLLTIASAVLMCGAHRGAASDDSKPQQSTKAGVLQSANGRPPDQRELHRLATQYQAGAPRPVSTRNPKHSLIANTPNTRKPVSEPRATPENAKRLKNLHTSNSRSVQAAATPRHKIPPSPNVRHRGSNPATVGGFKSSTAGSTGAINGTRMGRKP